jgi:hypothetical protein
MRLIVNGKGKQSLLAKLKRIRKDCTILPFIALVVLTAVFLIGFAGAAHAQDGNAGIQEATNKVKGYFDTGCDLMYAIGAVVGIIGAVKVFNKWNAGEPDTNKVAAAWFGSCIFLVVVATVLKSFFGI